MVNTILHGGKLILFVKVLSHVLQGRYTPYVAAIGSKRWVLQSSWMQDLIYLTQSASKKLKSKKDILYIDCHK